MSKYDPLGNFLRDSGAQRLPMTFDEIERVLGFRLPPSKKFPAWWSNNPSNNVMTRVWLAAGYQTEQVDSEGEKLVFRRVAPAVAQGAEGLAEETAPFEAAGEKAPRRHPLFGRLKGKITIVPGTDLTQPADPTWGERA
jgi:hypothetical protein